MEDNKVTPEWSDWRYEELLELYSKVLKIFQIHANTTSVHQYNLFSYLNNTVPTGLVPQQCLTTSLKEKATFFVNQTIYQHGANDSVLHSIFTTPERGYYFADQLSKKYNCKIIQTCLCSEHCGPSNPTNLHLHILWGYSYKISKFVLKTVTQGAIRATKRQLGENRDIQRAREWCTTTIKSKLHLFNTCLYLATIECCKDVYKGRGAKHSYYSKQFYYHTHQKVGGRYAVTNSAEGKQIRVEAFKICPELQKKHNEEVARLKQQKKSYMYRK